MAEIDAILASLSSPDNDKRVAGLARLTSHLKQEQHVDQPDGLIAALKPSIHSSNAHVSAASLSCLPPLFSALVSSASAAELTSPALRRDPSTSSSIASSPTAVRAAPSPAAVNHLKQAFVALLPLERMGDTKERTRELAREAIVAAGRAALSLGVNAGNALVGGKEREGPWTYLSRVMQESAFGSKSAKAREQAVHYLIALRDPSATHPLPPLRPFTPCLLPLLGDSDAAVRALALKATIDIFSSSTVTPAAKADLKKEMIKRDVGKKVQDTILAAVLGGGGSLEPTTSSNSIASGAASSTGATNDEPQKFKPTLSASLSASTSRGAPKAVNTSSHSPLGSLPAAAFLADPSAAPGPILEIQPVYIANERDLTNEFEQMKGGFEGRESEHNWMIRDRSVATMRGMIKAGVHKNFPEAFLVGIKSVQEGILKTVSSLRTTVATSALSLLSELSIEFGPKLDSFLDTFLSHTLGMAGQTKKIVAFSSQATATVLMENAGYHHRTLQLLWIGMQEKTTSARAFMATHIGTFARAQGRQYKHAIEASGGLDEIEKSLKKGLADANPEVKQNSRASFWDVQPIWPDLGATILEGLDPKSRKQLEAAQKGTAPKTAAVTAVAKPATGPRPPSVRAFMAQAKAAKEAEEAAAAAAAEAQQAQADVHTSPAPEARMATAATPIKARPSDPTTPLASSHRRDSHPKSPPSSIPRPISSRETPVQNGHEDQSLLEATSPFVVDGKDAALDFDRSPTATRGARRATGGLVLPVTEPIVDDALRDQAAQAEQAAERLLEIDESDADTIGTPLGPGGQPVAVAEKTSAPLPALAQRTPMRKVLASDVFEDSPDPKDGNGGAAANGKKNWWAAKIHSLPAPSPLKPDSEERTNEINSFVSALESGQIDAAGLRKLAALSKERPLPEEDEQEVFSDSNGSAGAFWQDSNHRFSRVYDGLTRLLKSAQDGDVKDAGLALLKCLIDHQFSAFAGDEAGLLSLLLHLREDRVRSTVAAIESIADSFAEQVEPLFGLGTLLTTLESYLTEDDLTDPQKKSFALGLKLMGRCFEGLPAEVLEEEIPKARDLIKRALNDAQSGDLRRAAVNCLVAAQGVLKDEQKLYAIVEGLTKDQLNLLSYYMNR